MRRESKLRPSRRGSSSPPPIHSASASTSLDQLPTYRTTVSRPCDSTASFSPSASTFRIKRIRLFRNSAFSSSSSLSYMAPAPVLQPAGPLSAFESSHRFVLSYRSYRDPSLHSTILIYRHAELPLDEEEGEGRNQSWFGIANECPHLGAPLERELRTFRRRTES